MNATAPVIADAGQWHPVAVRAPGAPWMWLLASGDAETLQAARAAGRLTTAQRREANGFALVARRDALLAAGIDPLEIPAPPRPWPPPPPGNGGKPPPRGADLFVVLGKAKARLHILNGSWNGDRPAPRALYRYRLMERSLERFLQREAQWRALSAAAAAAEARDGGT